MPLPCFDGTAAARRLLAVSTGLALALWAGPSTGAQSTSTGSHLPTLFVIGDSTVKNGTAGQVGWGDPIAEYFDPAAIHVTNVARGGRSSRTYQTEGLWENVVDALSPGDFVIMQFGHNDGSPLFTGTRPRGSIKGIGDETQEGAVEMTGQHEVVHTFGWYMRKYIADARAKGATPFVCSPIPRNIWKSGRLVRDEYGIWARDVAASSSVAFVDLNEIIARRYEEMGPEKVNTFFPADHTHTNSVGAELNAASVISGLRALRPCPLCAYFSQKAAAIPALQ
jgi:rhamnogalacturonan acetylesterase